MSSKSQSSNNTLKQNNVHSIPIRIEFIKNLLDGKELKPLINFESIDTEDFKGYNSDLNSDEERDTGSRLGKRVYNFIKIMNQIGGNLIYIKSGATGHTFKGISTDEEGNEINYAIKVVAYSKKDRYGRINDVTRPENAELMMIKLLGYFVVRNQTPHIVLPIGTFNTNIRHFTTLVEQGIIDKDEDKKYVEFLERYKKGEYHDEVSVLISEWANRGDLLDFIRKYYKTMGLLHWKAIFFQLLSALAIIHTKFPSFRHNDLKANNILIHRIERVKKIFIYTVDKNKFYVPNIGYQIKIWDFDFACIPGIVENSKVTSDWTKVINVTPTQNRYYDMHYFFNTLIRKGFFPQLLTEPEIPYEVKEFIDRIVPAKLREGKYIHKRGRILINKEFLTPYEVILNDEFFEEFRKNPNNYKNNDNININEFNTPIISNTTNTTNIINSTGILNKKSNRESNDNKKKLSKNIEKTNKVKNVPKRKYNKKKNIINDHEERRYNLDTTSSSSNHEYDRNKQNNNIKLAELLS